MTVNTPKHQLVDEAGLVKIVKTMAPEATTATLSSNAATVTKYAVQVTTESLTTAAGSSQACTLTLAGVSATDMAFVQLVGGTNTRLRLQTYAACTANTVTVTIVNTEASNAVNGTIIFNVWVIKA